MLLAATIPAHQAPRHHRQPQDPVLPLDVLLPPEAQRQASPRLGAARREAARRETARHRAQDHHRERRAAPAWRASLWHRATTTREPAADPARANRGTTTAETCRR